MKRIKNNNKKMKKVLYVFLAYILFCVNILNAFASIEYGGKNEGSGSETVPAGTTVEANITGTRVGSGSIYGYRISLLKRNGNSAKTIAVYDYIQNNSDSVYFLKQYESKLDDKAPYENGDYKYYYNGDKYNIISASTITANIGQVTVVDAAALSFDNVKVNFRKILSDAETAMKNKKDLDLLTSFSGSNYYKLMINLAKIAGKDTFEKYECKPSNAPNAKGNCGITESNMKVVDEYKQLINDTYIIIEPIVTIKVGKDSDNKTLRRASTVTQLAKKYGASYSNDINKRVATVNWWAFGKSLNSLDDINTNDFPYFKDGVSDYAKYEDVSYDSNYTPDKNYLGVRDLLQDPSYGYGVNIIHLYLTGFDTKCSYEQGMDKPTLIDMYADHCCEPSENWIDYNSKTGKSAQNELWRSTAKFKTDYLDTGICAPAVDSCTKDEYDKIVSGTKLSTPLKINGNETTLRTCCWWDAYKKKDGTNALDGTLTKEQFDANTTKYCGCTQEIYSEIINNKGSTTVFNKDLVIKDVTQPGEKRTIKYKYCCDFSAYNGTLVKDGKPMTESHFNTKLYNKYCLDACDIKHFEDLLDTETGQKDATKLVVYVGGVKQEPLYCCDKSRYSSDVLNTIYPPDNAENKKISSYFNPTTNRLDIAACKNPYCQISTTLDNGIRETTINGKVHDCCTWEGYADDPSNPDNAVIKQRLTEQTGITIKKKSQFVNYLKSIPEYNALCYEAKKNCEWNGDATIRWQKIDGDKCPDGTAKNEYGQCDCCSYKNLQTPDGKTVIVDDDGKPLYANETQFKKEDPWYNAVCNMQYCTVDSINENDNSCCPKPYGKGISAYSKEDQDKFGNDEGLKNHLIDLGIYYKFCPTDCGYGIDGNCPDCESKQDGKIVTKKAGKIYDVVRDQDSTDYDVDEEVLKCIVQNKEGGLGYDSYFVESLGNRFCEVYCTDKVEYNYPRRSLLTSDGGRLIYTNNIKPKINVTMTCRVKKIDVKKFEKELKSAYQDLIQAYNDYNLWTNIKRNIKTTTEKYADCCTNTSGGFSCCLTSDTATYTPDSIPGTNETVFNGDTSDLSSCLGKKSENNGDSIVYTVTCCKGGRSQSNCNDDSFTATLTGSGQTCNSAKPSGKSGNYYAKEGGGNCKVYKQGSSTPGSCDGSHTFNLTIDGESDAVTLSGGEVNGTCEYNYCKTHNYTGYAPKEYVENFWYTVYTVKDIKTITSKSVHYTGGSSKTCQGISSSYSYKADAEISDAIDRIKAANNDINEITTLFEKCGNLENEILDYASIDIDLKISYRNKEYNEVQNVKLIKHSAGSTKKTFEAKDYIYKLWAVVTSSMSLSSTNRTVTLFKDNDKINTVQVVKSFEYEVPASQVYQYVNKQSKSHLEKDKQENDTKIEPHFPVAFDTKQLAEVVLQPEYTGTGLGNRSYFNEGLCTDPYICSFNGGNGCIIPVYRPIDLNDPFPDQNDSKRLTGVNWCASDITGCSNNNSLVQKVIKNNRNITTNDANDVYNLTPLYTINLTPSTIKKIKEYNKTTSYGDYNLKCDNTYNGRHCKSLFIRQTVNGQKLSTNLVDLGALDINNSCALLENAGVKCKTNDFYETKQD